LALEPKHAYLVP